MNPPYGYKTVKQFMHGEAGGVPEKDHTEHFQRLKVVQVPEAKYSPRPSVGFHYSPHCPWIAMVWEEIIKLKYSQVSYSNAMVIYRNVRSITHFQDDDRCYLHFAKGKGKGIDCHGVTARNGKIDQIYTTSGCGANYVFGKYLRDCLFTPENKILYCDQK